MKNNFVQSFNKINKNLLIIKTDFVFLFININSKLNIKTCKNINFIKMIKTY